MKIQITDRLGRILGFYENRTYYGTRSYAQREIFIHPKYFNAMGLSDWLIERLKELGTDDIHLFVPDFEKEPFWAIVSFKDFMEHSREFQGKGINSDKQHILYMHYWTRRYLNQRELIIR